MIKYDEELTPNKRPVFKPGDTPYLYFGDEILNNNIPWSAVLTKVMQKSDLNISQIAGKLETSINRVKGIIDGNNCPLTFEQGARLLALEEQY